MGSARGKMGKIRLPADDDALLDECRVSTYRAQGRGGQHVNVTDSAVRLTHLPTGIVVTCQRERSQYLNKRECLLKLRQKVKELNYRKPRRIPTRVPRSVKERGLAAKKRDSQKKRLRRPPPRNEEY